MYHVRTVVLLLMVFCCNVASGQKPFIRDFSLSETNAGVKVNALAQDSIGYIWIGTDIGLIRFNGRSFIKIQDSIHVPVTAIAVTGQNVWVGYNNGKIGEVEDLS